MNCVIKSTKVAISVHPSAWEARRDVLWSIVDIYCNVWTFYSCLVRNQVQSRLLYGVFIDTQRKSYTPLNDIELLMSPTTILNQQPLRGAVHILDYVSAIRHIFFLKVHIWRAVKRLDWRVFCQLPGALICAATPSDSCQ